MCEFNVILDKQVVFGDVIYVKIDGSDVMVRNIIGDTQQYKSVKITEINVATSQLVLETVKI
ncbi:MAG: CooT family nickel-binding protein [Nitrososphaerota archaeon]|jgi:predicted RNA-binding protein|nr:CooT family nickel-binding protein [Nitrososphaerota archaeon]